MALKTPTKYVHPAVKAVFITLGIVLALLILVNAGLIVAFNQSSISDTLRWQIITTLEELTGRHVDIGAIGPDIFNRIVIEDLVIGPSLQEGIDEGLKDTNQDFFTVGRITIEYNLLELIKNNFDYLKAVEAVVLYKPTVSFEFVEELGRWNFDDLFSRSQGPVSFSIPEGLPVSATQGTAKVLGFPLFSRDEDIEGRKLALNAEVVSGNKIRIEIDGEVSFPVEGWRASQWPDQWLPQGKTHTAFYPVRGTGEIDLTNGTWSVKLTATNVELTDFNYWLPPNLGVDIHRGKGDLELNLVFNQGFVDFSGILQVKNAGLNYFLVPFAIERASGTIRFDSQGIQSIEAVGYGGDTTVTATGYTAGGWNDPRVYVEMHTEKGSLKPFAGYLKEGFYRQIAKIKDGELPPVAQYELPASKPSLLWLEEFSVDGFFDGELVLSGYLSQLVFEARAKIYETTIEHPQLYLPLKNVSGFLVYEDGNVTIDSFTGNLDSGIVNIAGSVEDFFGRPYLNLKVGAKNLNIKQPAESYLNLKVEGLAGLQMDLAGFLDQSFALFEATISPGSVEGFNHEGFTAAGRVANGILEIDDLKGSIMGSSVLATGALILPEDIASVLYPHQTLKGDSFLEVNIQGLAPREAANALPALLEKLPIDPSRIEGEVDISLLARVSDWNLDEADVVGNVESRSLAYDDIRAFNISGGFFMKKDHIGIESIQAEIAPATVLVSGTVPLVTGRDLDLNLKVNTFEPASLAALYPILNDVGGRIDLNLQVGGSLEAPLLTGSVDWLNPSFREVRLKRIFGTMKGNPDLEVIDLTSMSVETLSGKTHSVSGHINTKNQLSAGLRVSVKDQEISEFLEPFDLEQYASGPVSFDLTLDGTFDNPFLKLELYQGPSNIYGFAARDINLTASYQNGLVLITRARGQVDEGSFSIFGTADLNKLSADLQINVERFPVAALPIPDEYREYVAGGLLSYRGKASGTLASPEIRGEAVIRDGVFLGERVDRLGVLFEIKGGDLSITNSEIKWGQGTLVGNAGLNLDSGQISGEVVAVRADISKIASLAGIGLPENIWANFTAKLSGTLDDPALYVDINRASIVLADIEPVLVAKVKYEDGLVQITDANLRVNGSTVYLVGHLNVDGSVNLTMQGENIYLENYKRALGITDDIAGNIQFKTNLNGTMENLKGQLELEATDMRYGQIKLSGLLGSFSVDGKGLRINEFYATLEGNELSVSGTIPWPKHIEFIGNLPFIAKDEELPLLLSIRSPQSDLRSLNDLVRGLTFQKGQLKVNVDVTGSWKNPNFSGYINLQDTALMFEPYPTPVTNLQGSIVFSGNRAEVENISAVIGTGTAKIDGVVYLENVQPEFSFNYDLSKVPYRTDLVRTVVTGKGRFNGTLKEPVLSGHIELESTEVDLANLNLDASPLPSLPITLDLNIDHKGEFRVRGLGIDVRGVGSVQVTGPMSNFGVDGRVEATEGRVVYLDNEFEITRAQLIFQRYRGIMPQISAEARNTLPDATVIVQINGTLGDLRTTLTSDPPMSETDIVRKLTQHRFGSFAGGNIQEALTEEVLRIVTNQIEQTVLSEVEDVVKETFKLDEFRLQPDILRRSMKFQAGKYLFENLYVSYSRTFELKPSEIVKLEYQLGDRTKLTTSLDNKGDFRLGIEFGISF
ncbi:MAG TPA: translocation/assembly module TamB domain-containing protein [Bacillota bacterium]|nr:hypothetical protein [Bacillota bacterium]HOA90253.1 translocation/assembly module TamB domain-containing protein [Bacillota bacterium]